VITQKTEKGAGRLPTDLLRGTSDGIVIFVQHDADLVHETDLLFIVSTQFGGFSGFLTRGLCKGCINLREELEDVLRRDWCADAVTVPRRKFHIQNTIERSIAAAHLVIVVVAVELMIVAIYDGSAQGNGIGGRCTEVQRGDRGETLVIVWSASMWTITASAVWKF